MAFYDIAIWLGYTAETATTVAEVGSALTIIGAGVSAVGNYEAGQSQKAAAAANADLQERQAQQAVLVTQVQNAVALQGARAQNTLDQEQSAATIQNAQAEANQAKAQASQSEQNIERGRIAAATALSHQQQGYSASGVVSSTGTPLAVLANTAGLMEGQAIDEQYKANVDRTNTLFKSSIDLLQGKAQGQAAWFQLNVAKESADIRGTAAKLTANNQMGQAEINRAAGNFAAQNATIGAAGGMLSAIGSAGTKYGSSMGYGSGKNSLGGVGYGGPSAANSGS